MPSSSLQLRELIIVALDDERFGLAVEDVREVHRAVLPASLPNAPAVVEGVINVRGELVPLLNIRERLGRPHRALRASDHLVVARANGRVVAFAVDQVVELARIPDSEITAAIDLMRGTAHVAGVAAMPDGVLVIHRLDTLLGAGELFALDGALAAQARA